MHNLYFSRFLYFLFFISVLSSCKKEGCTDALAINYDNKAKNDDGNCEYLTDKFTGKFIGNESCNDSTENNTPLVISRLSNANDKVVLNNFTRYAIAPIAIVKDNKFIIENQNHPSDFFNININGEGTISNNSLIINYITVESGDSIKCSYIGSK